MHFMQLCIVIFELQGGGLIWFPPYMVWLCGCFAAWKLQRWRPFNNYLNGHNSGSDYHFLMKLSGFLNYGQEKMPKKFQVDSSLFEAFEIFAFFRQISKNGPISPIQNSIDLIY